MARDEKLLMRNGLVIPGVLVTVYGVIAIAYAERLRSKSDWCADSNLILIAGICYTVWKLILPLVLVGIALAITGITAFRRQPEELEGHLKHGTPTHTTLALLLSFVGMAVIGWIVQTARQVGSSRVFEINMFGARYEHTFLLELLILASLIILIPYLSLYLGVNGRRHAFMAAAEASMATGQKQLPHEDSFDFQDTTAAEDAQAGSMVPDEDWPAGREGEPSAPHVPIGTSAGIVGCMAKTDGRSCTNGIVGGARFCAEHGCQGKQRGGAACNNVAHVDGLCAVHAVAA
jgi:hypothetical protein